MDCRKFRHNLEDYLQGELDFPGRFGMERHAQQCLGCGKEVADAQKLGEMARTLSRAKAPVNFEAMLLQKIQRTRPRRRWALWRYWVYGFEWLSWRSAAAAAVAATLLFAAGFIGSRWRQEEPLASSYEPAPPPSRQAEERLDAAAAPASKRIQAAGPRKLTTPLALPPDAFADYPIQSEFEPAIRVEPAGSGFVEYLIPGPGDRQLIMRFPKAVRMQYGPPSEEYFIRNVSH